MRQSSQSLGQGRLPQAIAGRQWPSLRAEDSGIARHVTQFGVLGGGQVAAAWGHGNTVIGVKNGVTQDAAQGQGAAVQHGLPAGDRAGDGIGRQRSAPRHGGQTSIE